MSLESKIDKLTETLETLIAALQRGDTIVSKKSVETVTEQASSIKSKVVDVPALTHEDLKAKCLEVARAGKKPQVKDMLSSYGAVKAADVAEDKIGEVIEKLGEL